MHARLVRNGEPATVVGDTEIDLAGCDVTGPQKLQ